MKISHMITDKTGTAKAIRKVPETRVLLAASALQWCVDTQERLRVLACADPAELAFDER
jgi:hypothetical protein